MQSFGGESGQFYMDKADGVSQIKKAFLILQVLGVLPYNGELYLYRNRAPAFMKLTQKEILILLLNILFVLLVYFAFAWLFFRLGTTPYIFQSEERFVAVLLLTALLLTVIVLKLIRQYSLKLFLGCLIETVLIVGYIYFQVF